MKAIRTASFRLPHKIHFFFSSSASIDVATEKTQQNLISGIEHFDATKLKHAETQEKNPLPDLDGKCASRRLAMKCGQSGVSYLIIIFVLFNFHFWLQPSNKKRRNWISSMALRISMQPNWNMQKLKRRTHFQPKRSSKKKSKLSKTADADIHIHSPHTHAKNRDRERESSTELIKARERKKNQ